MTKPKKERRHYVRFDTEMKVCFQAKYEIHTKINFSLISKQKKVSPEPQYSGITKNISVEGLCFVSEEKLKKDDLLLLDVFPPNVGAPVCMEGEVLWSKKVPNSSFYPNWFHTGLKLVKINNRPVSDSIYFDQTYNVVWSLVLETVFSSFLAMVRQVKKKKSSS